MSEFEKQLVGRAAASYVCDNMVVGLGTGSTVRYFAEALAERISNGFLTSVVPTSMQSIELANINNIPLTPEDEWETIDLCVDGADEISPDFSMIKGGGGALLWEKIVASASRKCIYIADSSKLVKHLGRFPLPVEVCRFAHFFVGKRLHNIAGNTVLRTDENGPYVTSSGNYIYDCHIGKISDPDQLHHELINIPGVIETGLFTNFVSLVISVKNGEIETRTPEEGAWWV